MYQFVSRNCHRQADVLFSANLSEFLKKIQKLFGFIKYYMYFCIHDLSKNHKLGL